MYGQLFSIIAPVLLVAGLGFAWARLGKPFDLPTVTQLSMMIGMPCLVLSSLSKLSIDLAAFGLMAGAAAAALLSCMALGFVALRLLGLPASSFLPSITFGNSGNLGLPLCLFAFGEAGLALAIAVFAISSVLQFTAGQMIAAGRLSPATLLKTPVIYAVIVAVVCMATGWRPPLWISNAYDTLAMMAIPIMLMALGVSLARLSVATMRASATVAVLRLVLGFAAGIGIAALFGLEGTARGVLIIQLAGPAAVFNFLWAQHYGRNAAAIAGVVVISTVLGFLLLPLTLAIALDRGLLGL